MVPSLWQRSGPIGLASDSKQRLHDGKPSCGDTLAPPTRAPHWEGVSAFGIDTPCQRRILLSVPTSDGKPLLAQMLTVTPLAQ